MTISELIKKLEMGKEIYGDIDVIIAHLGKLYFAGSVLFGTVGYINYIDDLEEKPEEKNFCAIDSYPGYRRLK